MTAATQLHVPTRLDSARQRAVAALSMGSPVVVVDDLRGTGCDLVASAASIDVSVMAHLIRYGSGFVCITVDDESCERLDLPPVEWSQRSSFYQGSPRVSVDVVADTTTGISGADRARTARALARVDARADEFTRPGHLVPVLVGGTTTTRPDLLAELVCGPAVFAAMEPTDLTVAEDSAVVRQGGRVLPVVRMSDFAYS